MPLVKREEETPVGFPLAPMIDIVFQLLVFFMCVTQMRNVEIEEDIKLPIATEALEKEEAPGQLILNVKKDGTIVINKESFRPVELAAALINTVDETKRKYPVFIRADRKTRFGNILDVLKACGLAQLWDISFAAYTEEPE